MFRYEVGIPHPETQFLDYVGFCWNSYKCSIPDEKTAMSIEATTFMLDLINNIGKRTQILDLGSGWTSAALRLYQKYVDPTVNITSVGTDTFWMIKTLEYLECIRVGIGKVLMWDQLLEDDSQFDFIVLDIDSTAKRHLYFNHVVDKIKDGATIIFDDMHKTTLRANLHAILISHFTFRWIEGVKTRDEYGRYACAAMDVRRKSNAD